MFDFRRKIKALLIFISQQKYIVKDKIMVKEGKELINNIFKLGSINVDSLINVSKALNTKSEAFSNALSFDEQIRQTLRASDSYKKARMNQILKEELEKVIDTEEETDNEATDNGMENNINELLAQYNFN